MIFIRKHDHLARLEKLGCTRIRTVVILGSVRSRARLAGGVVLDYASNAAVSRVNGRRPARTCAPAAEQTEVLASNAA